MMLGAQLLEILAFVRSPRIGVLTAVSLIVGAHTISPHGMAHAQESIAADEVPQESANLDLEAVRKQLSQAASMTKTSNAGSDGFAVVDGDIEKANAELSMAEEQLIKQLQKAKVPASSSPAAATNAGGSSNIQSLNDQLDKTDAAIKELNANISEQMASLKLEEKTKKEAASASSKAIATSLALNKENARLRQEIASLQGKYAQAARDLEAARNRLMVAETEVERLSTIVQSRAKTDLAAAAGVPAPRQPQSNPQITRTNDKIPRPDSAVGPDMPVATVVAEKANLRIGPSLKDSPLMSVSQGTRLTVERRDGEWYRVIAPTGARAWVSSDVVQFGRAPSLAPDATVRVLGVKESKDSDNFTLVEKHGTN